MKQIKFTTPFTTGNEIINISKLFNLKKFSGDGHFTKLCSKYISDKLNVNLTLLTTSGTHSLEMAAMLIGIEKGDEIIMPSFTFVSSANAFILRGAKVIFVDISPESLNVDINSIERAITTKTKAIVPVHYAGMSCDMEKLMDLARKHNLYVIEDAAQAFGSKYKDKYLGTYGDFGCISFHDTKNIHCGEGGALLINNKKFSDKAEIVREKGTDRSKFIKGIVDKYTWQDIGSSYLPSELNSAFLLPQLESSDQIISDRKKLWDRYHNNLLSLKGVYNFKTLIPDDHCKHNGHIFLIILESKLKRDNLIIYLRENNIQSTFHYIPLHSAPAGLKYSEFIGDDKYTTSMSERLIRLPLHNELQYDDVDYICTKVVGFFKEQLQ